MSNLPAIGNLISSIGSDIVRFAPEPQTRNGVSFGSVLKGVGDVISDTSSALVGGVDPIFMDLINKQIESQQQMQLVSFESNIEKSKHETQMAAIRNIRVG